MKNRNSWKLSLLGTALLLPLAGACRPEATSPLPPTAALTSAPAPAQPVVAEVAQTEPVAPAPAVQPAEAPAPEPDLANAPVKPITTEKPLPANVRPYGPVAEVIKLTASSVDEGVLLAFVTNSAHLFNPTADEIIYLNDLGIPASVVTAMMQHDQALRQAGVTAEPAPEVAAQPAPPAAPAPAPAPQYAPQPEAAPAVAPAPAPAPAATTVAYAAPAVQVSEPVFYDSLSPYGNWVEVEGYGRCWQPSVVVVNPGWTPYYDGGHWVYSDCGWYWSSDYSWGWAPFHYGRWFRHHHMGWCWAPDTVWGPSWVCWRYTDAHCGWAPLPPGAWFRPGIGLTFHGHHVDANFSFGLGFDHFTFVAIGHLGDAHLHGHALGHAEARRIYDHSVVHARFDGDSHRVVNHGIAPDRVAAVTHKPLRPVAIRESQAPPVHGGRPERLASDGKSLTVFRPPMGATAAATTRTASSGGRSDMRLQGASSLAPSTTTATRAPSTRLGQTTQAQVGNGPRSPQPQLDHQPAAATPAGSTAAKENPRASALPATPHKAGAASAAVNPAHTAPAVSSGLGSQPATANRGTLNPAQSRPATTASTAVPRTGMSTPQSSSSRWSNPSSTVNPATTTPKASTTPGQGYTANRLEAPKSSTSTYSSPNRYAPAPTADTAHRQAANPSYQVPQSQNPSYQAPRPQAPAYQAPSYQNPSYQAPRPQTPAYQNPSYQAPRYTSPAQSDSRSASSYRPPTESPRYNSGSAPSYSSRAPAPSSGGPSSSGSSRSSSSSSGSSRSADKNGR